MSEQPWGLTLGALARGAETGELTLVDGALRVVLAFDAGRLVAATSTMRAASLLERAARTFELTRGSYTIADRITLRAERAGGVDLRAVVFAGARKYLSDDRLAMELRELGSRFTLPATDPAELARYDLETADRIVDALRDGASLGELDARYHDIDGRELRAAVYALVCCGAARGLLPSRAPTPPNLARTPTPPGAGRTPTPATDRTPTRPDAPRTATRSTTPRAQTPVPQPSRTITPDTGEKADAGPTPLARIPTVNVPRSKTPPDPAAPGTQPRAVTREEPAAPAPTPQRPRTPTPASIGRTPTRATPAGGTPIIAAPAPDANPEAAAAAERARRHLAADEHDEALREASAALRLAPESFDYHALHAWAAFCASRDKAGAADTARKILEKASHRAAAPIEARFLLGRLERIVGREREALRHFRAVLEHDPGHTAAAAELRELEAQLEAFARR